MKISKRTALFLVAVGAAAIATVGAYAYWTTTNSGTGTATTGTSANLTVAGTAATALAPGSSSTVTFTVSNPSAGVQRLGTIAFTGITPVAGCVAADFTMSDVVANQNFPTGNGQAVTATGTVTYADSGINQDTCKSKSITLNFG
jgi:hypothetical protein